MADDAILGPGHKSVPPRLWGRSVADVVAGGLRLSELQTPILTFDRTASDGNVAQLVAWSRQHGIELAPHGKTTMSPELWRRLLDAGCWGITFATPWQVQVARAAGISRIVLANELVDPVGAGWVAAELDADPGFAFVCWVDSVDAVAVLAATSGTRPIDVAIEVGGAGGRTGARGTDATLAVADAVAASPRLRLRGVAGYEGSYGRDRSPETVARVRAYLRDVVAAFDALEHAGLLAEPFVSAGGSAWFDLVAEELAPLRGRATVIVRAGAFQAHDDVFYDGIAPLPFRAALRVRARVLSRPEPGLAILDAGARDLPADYDLPVVIGEPGGRIERLSDQHAFLRLPDDARVGVGDVVRLGISHPCTALQLWRLVPEVADADDDDPRIIGFVGTSF